MRSTDIDFLVYFIISPILFPIVGHTQFVESAAEYGVVHSFSEFGWGSGLSLADVNGDGRDDLTLASGLGSPLALYLQTDSGLVQSQEPSLVYINQAIRGLNWVDYDNDGDKDLFITHNHHIFGGGLALYRHEEDGSFTDVTLAAQIDPIGNFYYGSTWADFDSDGFLDLYVCKYVVGDLGKNPFYRNNGDGTFTEMADLLGVADRQGLSFNSIFFDMDMDGDLDLFTSNDRFPENRLYENLNFETYTDVSAETGMNAILNSMSAELGDFDNDHDFDIYVTNTVGEFSGPLGNALFRNEGDNFSWLQGIPTQDMVGSFWGANFIDFDYDRDLDLYTVNSDRSANGYSSYMYLNEGNGNFISYPGTEFQINEGHHFASAQGDLNNDGFLDLMVSDGYLGNSQLWIGPSTINHWIKVHLQGTVSNRDGIGSLIEVWSEGVKRIDQTTCTSSHLAQDSFDYPFGLGTSTQADTVVIRWPSGLLNKAYDLGCGQRFHFIENPDQVTLNCSPEFQLLHNPVSGFLQEFEISNTDDIFELQWSIDGMTLGTGNTLQHEFDTTGTFLLCAEVQGYCGSASFCDTIIISCETPQPAFTFDLDLLDMSTTDLSLAADSIVWTINGEQVSNEASFQYTFNEAGSYELCLTAYNECGSDSICSVIEVSCPYPVPSFAWELSSQVLSVESSSADADSLHWTLDEIPFSDAQQWQQYIETPGLIELCLWAFNSCGADSICEEILVTPNSILDMAELKFLHLYPNPSHDFIRVQMEPSGNSISRLSISDLSGRIHMEMELKESLLREGEFILDLHLLSPGAYTLMLMSEDAPMRIGRFMKY